MVTVSPFGIRIASTIFWVSSSGSSVISETTTISTMLTGMPISISLGLTVLTTPTPSRQDSTQREKIAKLKALLAEARTRMKSANGATAGATAGADQVQQRCLRRPQDGALGVASHPHHDHDLAQAVDRIRGDSLVGSGQLPLNQQDFLFEIGATGALGG